jgi:hypothetical protein
MLETQILLKYNIVLKIRPNCSAVKCSKNRQLFFSGKIYFEYFLDVILMSHF